MSTKWPVNIMNIEISAIFFFHDQNTLEHLVVLKYPNFRLKLATSQASLLKLAPEAEFMRHASAGARYPGTRCSVKVS